MFFVKASHVPPFVMIWVNDCILLSKLDVLPTPKMKINDHVLCMINDYVAQVPCATH